MSKMKKSVLSALLMIMLGCVLVNAREYVVLTQDSPDATVSSGESVTIYGTSDANQVTIESGADVELVNFSGSNTVSIESDSEGFTVSRSGAMVTVQGSDGTRLKIPATQTAQIVDFTDRESLTLSIDDGVVMLDDQVVTTTAASIDSSSEVTSECGAYIAPGVWKEFDCYNLAAIGKTTGDDPFTPSWRLIGGYWQWGRKGPDSNQWYDTNTANFVHGPTGPDEADANDDAIDGWDTSSSADGAWSDDEKTSNDPCPTGYRVPTKAQWEGVVENNTQSTVGTWSVSYYDATNYSCGRFFGDDLILPTAGYRSTEYGVLHKRGKEGNYWSRTGDEEYSYLAWKMHFDVNESYTEYYARFSGYSVRCITEDGTQSIWYKDSDGDGYSDGEIQKAYTRPGDDYYLSTELIATDGDYDDDDDNVHPGAEEICGNGIDDDCDGAIDEACTSHSGECGAYIAPGVWKEFDCYNLAAIGKTTGDDPFTPSWRLIGGYWQWGRKGPDEGKWYDSNTVNFAHGPTGPEAEEANDGQVSGWDADAPDGAWSESEITENDPCPVGYRVPSKAQWEGVIDNNVQAATGTWDESATNYSAARFFGERLMLPATGRRESTGGAYANGSLTHRGYEGFYWSSSQSSISAYYMFLGEGINRAGVHDYSRTTGQSLRCIAE